MATHSSTLAWRIPMYRGARQAAVHAVAELDTTEQLKHSTGHHLKLLKKILRCKSNKTFQTFMLKTVIKEDLNKWRSITCS